MVSISQTFKASMRLLRISLHIRYGRSVTVLKTKCLRGPPNGKISNERRTATHELTRKFESDWGNAFHRAKSFDFHLWKYQEVLRQFVKKDTAWKTLYNKVNDIATKADDSQPRFESMFMADHRALAVGSFEKIVEDPKDLRTKPRTRKIYHNMSGFYGHSGGMVCHFEGGDILKPKVIGLCEEPTLILFLTR